MVSISLVIGNAGTGKSYKLKEYIEKISKLNKSYVVLAFTHSAVNNLGNDNDHYMTIHKYFKINFKSNTISLYNFTNLDYMFIDEFSLISKDLFLLIFPIICKTVRNLILFGDYKQLAPITTNNVIEYDLMIEYLKIEKDESQNDKEISENRKRKINIDNIVSIKTYNDSILSLQALQRNVKRIAELTEIKRNDKHIIDIINSLCFENDNDKKKTILDNNLITFPTLLNLLLNNDFVFISSKYRILYEINKAITRDSEVLEIPISETNSVYLRDNEIVIFTETVDDFCNGDELIVKDYKKQDDNMIRILFYDIRTDSYKYYTNEYIPILPRYITTFHKSQGRTINNVILCLDNLFEYQMLYTGLSRTKNKLFFYIYNQNNKNDIYNSIFKISSTYSQTIEIFNEMFLKNNKR